MIKAQGVPGSADVSLTAGQHVYVRIRTVSTYGHRGQSYVGAVSPVRHQQAWPRRVGLVAGSVSPWVISTRRNIAGDHPHQLPVAAAVRQLAVRAVDRTPPFGDIEDHRDLLGQQRMHRAPAWCLVNQGAGHSAAGPPAVHPLTGDLPQRCSPMRVHKGSLMPSRRWVHQAAAASMVRASRRSLPVPGSSLNASALPRAWSCGEGRWLRPGGYGAWSRVVA